MPLLSPPPFPRNRPTSRKHLQLPVQSHNLPVPPRLNGSRPLEKGLHATRSCDGLQRKANAGLGVDGDEFGASNSHEPFRSPPSTPRSLPLPSPTRTITPSKRGHRRSLSVAIPYRSPPASPTIASPPPPVPPIPEFALNPTDKKAVLHPRPSWPAQIYIPDLNVSPPSDARPRISPQKSKSAPDVRRENGMTCLKFFSLRNSSPRGPRTAVA